MSRRAPYNVRWRGSRRTWHVGIRDERAMIFESVTTEHPTLAEALREALEQAEQKGWPLPRT